MINIKALLNLNYYVSELDQFLKAYDKRHSKLSGAKQREVDKYKRIFHLRDNANPLPDKKNWDQF